MWYRYCNVYRQDDDSGEDYNFAINGCTDIVYAMLKGCCFDDMSETESIKLVKSAIDASIVSYKYRPSQLVGGNVDVYVITSDYDGWIFNNDIQCICLDRDVNIDDVLGERMRK